MDVRWFLMTMLIVLPVVAAIVTMLSGLEMPERYHLHHDTYAISPVVSRSFVLNMLFMGMLGTLVGWLCRLGVFAADPLIPAAFFTAFLVSLYMILMLVLAYRVTVYDDRMIVHLAFRGARTIYYDEIESMEWIPSLLDPRLRDLNIVPRTGRKLRVWCLLDIEKMLLRIDRFDAFVE